MNITATKSGVVTEATSLLLAMVAGRGRLTMIMMAMMIKMMMIQYNGFTQMSHAMKARYAHVVGARKRHTT